MNTIEQSLTHDFIVAQKGVPVKGLGAEKWVFGASCDGRILG